MAYATRHNTQDRKIRKAREESFDLEPAPINPLLSKFKAVSISPLDMIEAKDREFIDKTELEYIDTVAKLNQWKEQLQKASDLLPSNDFVQLEKTTYGGLSINKDYEGERTEKKWFNSLLFSPSYAFKYIADNLQLARAFRNREILEYFNNRYNLQIRDDHTISFEVKTVEKVVDYIISRTDGKGLFQKGKENIISNMKHYFRDAILEAESITFPGSKWGSRYGNDTLNNKDTLGEALSLFENDALTMSEDMKIFIDDVRHHGFLYQFAAGVKFKSIRYYKNGKRTIYFADSAASQEFFQLFQYEQVEK
jgi:hypothetical protein